MMELILQGMLSLILAFASACLTKAVYFGMGQPNSLMLDYIEGNLFSAIGKWALVQFKKYEAKSKGINPYKVFTCPYCLGQWLGLLLFAICAYTWHIHPLWVLPHAGFAHYFISKTN